MSPNINTDAQLDDPNSALPYSREAEAGVLTALLADNSAWHLVSALLTDCDFYLPEHGLIYRAVSQLIDANMPADAITVHAGLDVLGKSEEAGGLAYLTMLAQSTVPAGVVQRYAEIVHERAILRALVAAGREIAKNALSPEGKTIPVLLDEAEQAIFNICEQAARGNSAPDSIESLVRQVLGRIEIMADDPKDVLGLSTGFDELDRLTAGLHPGDVVVLAGRPTIGKTTMAINIAEHVAVNEALPALMFSMEISASELATRMLGSLGRIDQSHMRAGKLTDEEWPGLVESVQKLSAASLHIHTATGMTASRMRSIAGRVARQCGKLGLLIVDDLQRMSESIAEGTGRKATFGEIMGNLKLLAKELQCPVIAVVPLSGNVETRTDKSPALSDLPGAGAIEQLADVILFINREDSCHGVESSDPGLAEIIIGKQRNGPTGVVKLAFSKPQVRFETITSAGDHDPESW